MKPKIKIGTGNFGIKVFKHIDRRGFIRTVSCAGFIPKDMQEMMYRSFYEMVKAAHDRDQLEIANGLPVPVTKYLKNLI